ncbi:MAG: M14 family metallopeptidase [Tistlia sp.]|uniref:M14 family metallopeptidase n=1 Tax=Tistlia sp. TaxID=3057121 RepID=UPI0034A462E6
MQPSTYFSASYREARRHFLEAARGIGAAPRAEIIPAAGPAGEELATDVLRIGPARAERVLVTICGTHGVEGYCGSGVQVGWLESGLWREVPHEGPGAIAQVLIHAINPYGFAWNRRVNEDNVDLNRNFVDFDSPLPLNAGYERLHGALCPSDWSEETVEAARVASDLFAEEQGAHGLQAAVSGGQYRHADGLFFGGERPVWSRGTLLSILSRELAGARRVAVVDYHTGLGPYGYGERIAIHRPGSAAEQRVAAWYDGDVTNPAAGTSTSAPLSGTISDGLERHFPALELGMIALEYGTEPVPEVLESLRADNWLHNHGDPATPLGREIKARVRNAFYGDTDGWKQAIWERALATQRQAVAALAEG